MSISSSEVKLEAKVEKARLYWIVTCECWNPIDYGVDYANYICGVHESREEAENSMCELKAMWESDPINFVKEILELTYIDDYHYSVDRGDLPSISFTIACIGSREIKCLGGAGYLE